MSSDESDINVPITAVEVKITSIINPYMMRMYEAKNYQQKECSISTKLQREFKLEKPEIPKKCILGSMVLTSNNICENGFELPSWICRGILGYRDQSTSKYTVFLVDYGYSVQLNWNEFVVVRKSLLKDEFLSTTIGLYDIIPVQASLLKHQYLKNKNNILITATEEWTEKAITLTKQLISVASPIMFDPIAINEDNRMFGELYLFIDDSIVRLRDILVKNLHAVYINNEIERLLYLDEKDETDEEKKKDYCFSYSELSEMGTSTSSSNKELETSLEDTKDTIIEQQNNKFDNNISQKSQLTNKMLKLMKCKGEGQTMLVHSKVKVTKLDQLEYAPFPNQIHKVLRSLHISGVRRIQSYIWPAILKGLNVAAVSSTKTGKTFGHAVAVVSSLVESEMRSQRKLPLALILCSSTKEVFEIAYLYNNLLINNDSIHVVTAYNGKDDKSLASEIYNGCQILISTPAFMLRFMIKYKEDVVSLKRLRFLVFDQADIIFNKYFDIVLKLITKYKVIESEHRVVESIPLQIITVAQQWAVPLKKFVQSYMEDAYICIDSCMEAAIYVGTKSRAIMLASNKKQEKISTLLNGTETMLRTIIICANMEEVIKLNDYLKSLSKNTLIVHEEMDCIMAQDEKKFWNDCVSGSYPILICTDAVLSELSINNVDHLIHYSFPLTSRRQFHFRFSTLMNNLIMGNKECKITLLIDESNELQLKSIIDPMKRLGIAVPEAWIKSIQYYVAKEDRKKEKYQICKKVKALGFCPNNHFCPDRHCILKGVDEPVTSIEVGDEITCIVNYIHDASHFSVRIINYMHTKANGEKEKITVPVTDSVKFSQKIQQYYSSLKHRRHSKNIAVGNVYAVEKTIDNFERVQVTNIEKKDDYDQPSEVTVRSIDSGIVIQEMSVYKLYEMPEELANAPSHIIDVFLTGIAPFDNEYDWNDNTITVAEEWIHKYSTPKANYIYGKVLFHVGNTLWIDSLEARTKVVGYRVVTASSLKHYLFEKNHAIENQNHLNSLMELYKDGGFDTIKTVDDKIDTVE